MMLNETLKRWQPDPEPAQQEAPPVRGQTSFWGREPLPRPLAFLLYSLTLAPTFALATVWALSWRISTIIGRWPLLMHDDPKFAAPNDLLSTTLHYGVFVWLMWSAVAAVMLPMLTLVLVRTYAPLRFLFLLIFFAATLALIRIDPGLRFMWFMD